MCKRMLSLCLLLALLLSGGALAEEGFALPEENEGVQTDERVPYTGEDVPRYTSIHENAVAATPPELAPPSLAEKTAWSDESFVYGMPTVGDITQEEALFSAYYTLESQYGVPAEDLARLLPDFTYWQRTVEDTVWVISLYAVEGDHLGGRTISVYIQAKTGKVEQVVAEE